MLMSQRIAIRKRQKARKKLLATISILDDIPFLQLIWAVNALQQADPPDVRRYLRYPAEAVGAKIGDEFFAYKWHLENLILLLLAIPKGQKGSGRVDYSSFGTAAELINLLHTAQELENRVLVNADNVLQELTRIQHAQAMWQREMFHAERYYRYYYVYGQGKAAEHFKEKNGVSINEFALACISIFFAGGQRAWQGALTFSPEIRLDQNILDRTMDIISKELTEIRDEAANRIERVASRETAQVNYLPSILREFPVIKSKKLGGEFIVPLPQLVPLRATSGLYYDLIGAHESVLEEANRRFEAYGKKLIEAYCPDFEVMEEHEFGPTRAEQYKTPDLLIKHDGSVKAVFECKATKLTFEAQFAENQYEEAQKAFDQIAKGMTQLWKFFSRVRRGLYTVSAVDPDAHGVILTMDTWFSLSERLTPALWEKASEMCGNDPTILPEDKRQIVFCAIEDLNEVLAVSNEDEFLATLAQCRQPKYHGWPVSHVRSPIDGQDLVAKSYPLLSVR